MDALLFIVAIAYVILSAAGKNKKLREKAAGEAARRRQAMRAAESDGSLNTDAPHAETRAPHLEKARPAAKMKPVQQPSPSVVSAPIPRTVAAPVAGTMRPLETRTREAIGTQLTQISETKRHTLEASTFTGHAHEETSMSGLQEECLADTARRRVALSDAPDAGPAIAAFDLKFDVDAVRKGFLYSEILARPKALRRS